LENPAVVDAAGPALIGFTFWKITGNGAWQITFWLGAALIALYRFGVRAWEWRF
jgi:hypothetical protein